MDILTALCFPLTAGLIGLEYHLFSTSFTRSSLTRSSRCRVPFVNGLPTKACGSPSIQRNTLVHSEQATLHIFIRNGRGQRGKASHRCFLSHQVDHSLSCGALDHTIARVFLSRGVQAIVFFILAIDIAPVAVVSVLCSSCRTINFGDRAVFATTC